MTTACRRVATLGGLTLLCLSLVAHASFDKGFAAWDSGDYRTALREFRQAAESGDLRAQTHLAQMYEDGQGGAVDLRSAVRWYQQAASAGDPQAQLNLGRLYRSGKGVEQSDREAVRWYLAAAQQGLSIAQFFMGLLYDTGKGVPSDYVQAYKWFDLAARQGDPDARHKRDRLAEQMTPSQVTEAERLTRAFLAGETAQPAATAAAPTAPDGASPPNPANAPDTAPGAGGGEGRAPLQVATLRPAGSLATLPAAPPPMVESTPLRADEIERIQTILNDLAYNAGAVDGRIGSDTGAAAARFRADLGEAAVGRIDRSLLARLEYVRSALPARIPIPRQPEALVKRLQLGMTALGYDPGPADGLIGPSTLEAARRYRREFGYPPSDTLNARLLSAIETRLAVRTHGVAERARDQTAAAIAARREQAETAQASLATEVVSAPADGAAAPAPGPAKAAQEASSSVVEPPAPSGEELVERIQAALAKHGFDPGPVDGKVGKKTRAAVKRYQERAKLRQDGQLTGALLAHLESDRAKAAGPHLRFVKPASQRELVRRAQVRLNSLGYSAGAPDGVPGSNTRKAVIAFQHNAGLSEDGRIDEALLRSLESSDAAAATAKRRPKPTTAELVRQIQVELNRLGYPAGDADGIIGRRTVNAARAFQRATGLSESDKLTPKLLRALKAAR